MRDRAEGTFYLSDPANGIHCNVPKEQLIKFDRSLQAMGRYFSAGLSQEDVNALGEDELNQAGAVGDNLKGMAGAYGGPIGMYSLGVAEVDSRARGRSDQGITRGLQHESIPVSMATVASNHPAIYKVIGQNMQHEKTLASLDLFSGPFNREKVAPGTVVTMSTIFFNDALIPELPEGAVAPRIGWYESMSEATTTPRGIGMEFGVEWWKTERGRSIVTQQYTQVENSKALTERVQMLQAIDRTTGAFAQYIDVDLAGRGEAACFELAMNHKYEYNVLGQKDGALVGLNDLLETREAKLDRKYDFVLMTPEAVRMAGGDAESRNASITGTDHANQARYDTASVFTAKTGRTVLPVALGQGGRQRFIKNPLDAMDEHGTHNIFRNTATGANRHKFSPEAYTTAVYDQDEDDMVELKFDFILDNCGVFDLSGPGNGISVSGNGANGAGDGNNWQREQPTSYFDRKGLVYAHLAASLASSPGGADGSQKSTAQCQEIARTAMETLKNTKTLGVDMDQAAICMDEFATLTSGASDGNMSGQSDEFPTDGGEVTAFTEFCASAVTPTQIRAALTTFATRPKTFGFVATCKPFIKIATESLLGSDGRIDATTTAPGLIPLYHYCRLLAIVTGKLASPLRALSTHLELGGELTPLSPLALACGSEYVPYCTSATATEAGAVLVHTRADVTSEVSLKCYTKGMAGAHSSFGHAATDTLIGLDDNARTFAHGLVKAKRSTEIRDLHWFSDPLGYPTNRGDTLPIVPGAVPGANDAHEELRGSADKYKAVYDSGRGGSLTAASRAGAEHHIHAYDHLVEMAGYAMTTMEGFFMRFLGGVKFSRPAIRKMVTGGIPMPYGSVYYRFHGRHSTESLYLLMRNTGSLLTTDGEWDVGLNVKTGRVVMSHKYATGAHIQDAKDVMLFKNARMTGYHGGFGTKPIPYPVAGKMNLYNPAALRKGGGRGEVTGVGCNAGIMVLAMAWEVARGASKALHSATGNLQGPRRTREASYYRRNTYGIGSTAYAGMRFNFAQNLTPPGTSPSSHVRPGKVVYQPNGLTWEGATFRFNPVDGTVGDNPHASREQGPFGHATPGISAAQRSGRKRATMPVAVR